MASSLKEPEATRALFRGLAGAALFVGGIYVALTAAATAAFTRDMPGVQRGAIGYAFLSMLVGAALAVVGWRLGMPTAGREDDSYAPTAPEPRPAPPEPPPEPPPAPEPEPEPKAAFPPPVPPDEEVTWRWEGKDAPPQRPEPTTPDIEPPDPPLPPKRGRPWENDEG